MIEKYISPDLIVGLLVLVCVILAGAVVKGIILFKNAMNAVRGEKHSFRDSWHWATLQVQEVLAKMKAKEDEVAKAEEKKETVEKEVKKDG